MTEQIEIENRLNIYELAKIYYKKRSGIWRHHVTKKNPFFFILIKYNYFIG